MKSVFCVATLSFFVASQAFADGGTCGFHSRKKSDCDVVRVLTRCDVAKYKLRKRIAELEEEIKELRSTLLPHPIYYPVIIRTVVQKEVIKHNILSLYMARDIDNTDTNGTTATVQTAYEPGLKYQYEFNFGLVPEMGVDVKGGFLFGLGWEF